MLGFSNDGGMAMKAIATVAAAAALMALTACDQLGLGGLGGNAAAGNDTAGNAAGNASGGKPGEAGNSAAAQPAAAGDKDPAAGAVPAAAAGPVTLDRAYVMGRWTDDGDCGNAVEFGSDGRFTAANGAGGLWHLAGDQLTMTGSGTLTLQIVPIDQNTMNVVNPDGSLGRSTRC